MTALATVNAAVLAVSMIIILLIYVYDESTQSATSPEVPAAAQEAGATPKPVLTYLNYPFNRSAFWYFFGALGWIFMIYLLSEFDEISRNWSDQDKELWHLLTHALKVFFSNLANVSLVIAAVAYGRGKNFDAKKARKWFGWSAIGIALWAFFWELVHHDTSLLYTSLLIAPDVVLSNVAFILLGWVFLSRWSGIGVAYFIITVLYAVLQFPARLALDLSEFLDPANL